MRKQKNLFLIFLFPGAPDGEADEAISDAAEDSSENGESAKGIPSADIPVFDNVDDAVYYVLLGTNEPRLMRCSRAILCGA